jgi:hypothetical protein
MLDANYETIRKECRIKQDEYDIASVGTLTRQPFYDWIGSVLKKYENLQ